MLKEVEILKIGLMTSGMVVSPKARQIIEGDEKRPLTLADYASTSGISIELPENVWVNAPIIDHNSNFVGATPYVLDWKDNQFVVRSGDNEFRAIPTPVPSYHNKTNNVGEIFTRFGITHTDRVRISPIKGCVNSCTFCDIPFTYQYYKKSAGDLVESIKVALVDPIQPAKHILISGGTPKQEDYSYLNSVYDSVVSSFPNHNVDVMMAPIPGLLNVESLRSRGINGLSINLELFNEKIAQRIINGKHHISRDRYLGFIAQASEVFGEGRVRSLLMVGLEPIEDTLRGVEALAQRGCDPVLSPFRPSPTTPLRNLVPPNAQILVEVYERARDIVGKYEGVKLGPRCIPCMHNTLTFPDKSGKYIFN